MRRWTRLKPPLRDSQLATPIECCSVCQGEIYFKEEMFVVGGVVLCEICAKELMNE